MERLSAEGKFFHRSCFKCDYCGTTLRLSSYAFDVEDGMKSRAATNDYFDNRLVGRLCFRLIGFKKHFVCLFYWQKTHYFGHSVSPHSVQSLSNKCANWMIHIQYFIRPPIIIKRKHKYFRNMSEKKLNRKMLLSFIGQITNWNNQIVFIPTITKMASYAFQQLAFLLPLCTFWL